jgi:probable HAF family extracellular repeat protein
MEAIRATGPSLRSTIAIAVAACLAGCGGGGDNTDITTSRAQLKPLRVACESERYTVSLLDSLGGTYSTPRAINNRGQVVGFSTTANSSARATLWDGTSVTDLGLAGEFNSVANDINEAGVVAGLSWGIRDNSPVSWSRSGATILQTPPGGVGAVFGINNSGQMVGETEPTMNGLSHASVWNKGALSTLPTLGGAGMGIAMGINDAGAIVGYSADAKGEQRATLWLDGSPVDLGSLAGTRSEAHAINNRGQIVGQGGAQYGNQVTTHATLWYRGTITDLGTLGGTFSRANAINNSGQIVGWSNGPDERPRPAIWRDAGATPVDLRTLVDGAGLQIGEPADINDRGQIAATALMPDGSTRAVVLTPTACH